MNQHQTNENLGLDMLGPVVKNNATHIAMHTIHLHNVLIYSEQYVKFIGVGTYKIKFVENESTDALSDAASLKILIYLELDTVGPAVET